MKLLLLFLVPICLSAAAEEIYGGYIGHWENVVATAYSPHDPIDGKYHASKGDRWRWITADGETDVRETPYGIAVPVERTKAGNLRPLIPFGTKVIIPVGQGYLDESRPNNRVFQIDDTGNGKEYFKHKNGMLHIDLRYKQHEWALKWGEKQIKVFIVTGVASPDIDRLKEIEAAKAKLKELESDPFYDPYYNPQSVKIADNK